MFEVKVITREAVGGPIDGLFIPMLVKEQKFKTASASGRFRHVYWIDVKGKMLYVGHERVTDTVPI